MEIKCPIRVMCLNCLKTIPLPPQSMEKVSSTKLVPGAKKVWDYMYTLKIFIENILHSLLY